MTIHAIYEKGVFRPLDVVRLPENCEVELSVLVTKASDGHPALARLLEIAEQFPENLNSPTDLATQHDHYLYGTSKRP